MPTLDFTVIHVFAHTIASLFLVKGGTQEVGFGARGGVLRKQRYVAGQSQGRQERCLMLELIQKLKTRAGQAVGEWRQTQTDRHKGS